MVLGELNPTGRRGLMACALALALASPALLAPKTQAVPNRDPGPFHPLLAGHVGQAYEDRLPTGARYTLFSGALPDGIALSPSGRLTGAPARAGSYAATISAQENSGRSYRVRVAGTVYQRDVSEVQGAPSFRSEGPYSTQTNNYVLTVVNTFDNQSIQTLVRLERPVGLGRPAPVLLFHRGRGFDEDSYTLLHKHIASHGIAVASIEDQYSFSGESFSAGNTTYDIYRAELGMLSASGVVEAVSDFLIDASDDPSSIIAGSLDSENLFFAGHSRGGGAVHASHQRSWELRLKGLIYLMAFDLRYFDEVAPPRADAPAYPIFGDHPRTPSLVIAAENDGDLTYPIADQLIDRATGPTTQVTVYGGVHNYIGDTHRSDGDDRITRTAERTQVADWVICFIKRWADLDESLDGRLYGAAHEGSAAVGVTSWSPSARTLVLEDAQDQNLNRNQLGANYVGGLRRRELSSYPSVGNMDSLGLKHVVLTPTSQVGAWRMASDRALDLTGHSRAVLRVSQTSRYGWSGMGLWLRLIDQAGNASWYQVYEPGRGGHLPDASPLSPHDRFVDVHVPLADFFGGSGGAAAELDSVRALDVFLVVRDGQRAGSVVADVVRFE